MKYPILAEKVKIIERKAKLWTTADNVLRLTENQGVGGSIPSLATQLIQQFAGAHVAPVCVWTYSHQPVPTRSAISCRWPSDVEPHGHCFRLLEACKVLLRKFKRGEQ